MNRQLFTCVALALLGLAACTAPEPPAAGQSEGNTPAGPTNRIDIPPAVVQNLGITFARVERRHVERTLRMPGAFELPASSERQYRAPLSGRVTLLVSQYGHVKTGDTIATIDSPDWRALQGELDNLDAELAIRRAELVQAQAATIQVENTIGSFPDRKASFDTQLKSMAAHKRSLEKARDVWLARITELEELASKGAGRGTELADVRGAAAEAEGEISHESVTRAELERARADLEFEEKLAKFARPGLEAAEAAASLRITAAQRTIDLKVKSAAAILGLDAASLGGDGWRSVDKVTVTANAPGMVIDLHVREGELLAQGDSLCNVVDHSRLQFRARALQTDLGRLKEGLVGRVVPPAGGTLDAAATVDGVILIAPMANAESRMVEVVMPVNAPPVWARPGVTAELEVVWDASDEPMLAMPNRALIRDGLEVLFFVRDPADANKVIRTVADTGPSDGRWTVVYAGVMEGSEVVLDGTYELKLTGGGKSTLKGHFHADGTFHAEGTPEPGG